MNVSKEFQEWLVENGNTTKEQLSKSAIFLGIVGDGFFSEHLCALQLGHAILMNKPIVLIVDKHIDMPQRLKDMAARIEYIDFKEKGAMDKAAKDVFDALEKILGEKKP